MQQRLSSRALAITSLVFLLSGATGLAYEVIWFKRFAHVWGSSSVAMASVVASFLFGLGAGAHLWGRVADGLRRPLLWYGVCEVAIGLLALVIPREIQGLFGVAASMVSYVPDSPLLQFAARFLITLVVLGPPCVLMGGTLPLLVRQCTSSRGSLSEATGLLYGINTLGAAAGCYLTGFHLLPALGLVWTNGLAATVNLLIGGLSIVAGWFLPRGADELSPSAPPEPVAAPDPAAVAAGQGPAVAMGLPVDKGLAAGRLPRDWPIYLAVMLTGWAALMLQMVWARQLALVVGGSTYAFTATLFVVLVAIALGSLIFHVWLRDQRWVTWAPLGIILVLALTTIAGKEALPWLANWAGEVRSLRAEPLVNAWICVVASMVLELLPSLAMGLLFPLFVQLTRRSAAEAGRAVGNVYAWNTVGALIGSTATSLVLVPWIGSDGAIALALALYGLAALATLPEWSPGGAPAGVAVALGALALVFVGARPTDPLDLNLGAFLYGPTTPEARAQIEVLRYEEGPVCNVLVAQLGTHRELRFNGKVDASNDGPDMLTQLGTGYFPFAFHPDARKVLVIGFGSGTTLGAVLQFPETRVTCVEIEPGVVAAADEFSAVNHRPLESPRARMVIGDGRTFLQYSPERYDLVISEPSNPWIAGISALFTREFFESVAQHLTDDGVLVQWLQTYNFTAADYALIVRTLREVFPHYGAFLLNGGDSMLVASRRPLLPAADNVERVQAAARQNPLIQADLARFCGGEKLAELLVMYYLFDQAALDRLVAEQATDEINTDLNLRLEFDAPLRLFSPAREQAADVRLGATLRVAWLAELAGRVGLPHDSPGFQQIVGNSLLRCGRPDEAVAHFAAAVRLDPALAAIYRGNAMAALQRGDRRVALVALEALVQVDSGDVESRRWLARLFFEDRRVAAAVEHLREVVRLAPETPEAINDLAWILATIGDERIRNPSEALELARRLAELKSEKVAWLDTLAAAQAANGDFAAAVSTLEEAIRQAEGNNRSEEAEGYRKRLKLYAAGVPYRES